MLFRPKKLTEDDFVEKDVVPEYAMYPFVSFFFKRMYPFVSVMEYAVSRLFKEKKEKKRKNNVC